MSPKLPVSHCQGKFGPGKKKKCKGMSLVLPLQEVKKQTQVQTQL